MITSAVVLAAAAATIIDNRIDRKHKFSDTNKRLDGVDSKLQDLDRKVENTKPATEHIFTSYPFEASVWGKFAVDKEKFLECMKKLNAENRGDSPVAAED